MNLPSYCLDAHPLVWYFKGQTPLSSKVKIILDDIFSQKVACYIPSIVLLEIFHLSLKHKRFLFPQFLRELTLPNIMIIPLGKVILKQCYLLPKKLTIHDRVVVATAKANNTRLVSKDKIIHSLPDLEVVW